MAKYRFSDIEKARQAGKKSTRKGVKDKFTKESIARISKVLTQLEKTLAADIKALDKTQRVKLWVELQEYVNPKLSRTDLTSGNKPIIINFNSNLKDV